MIIVELFVTTFMFMIASVLCLAGLYGMVMVTMWAIGFHWIFGVAIGLIILSTLTE